MIPMWESWWEICVMFCRNNDLQMFLVLLAFNSKLLCAENCRLNHLY